MNGGGNGAETHQASVSGAEEPAEKEKKKTPPQTQTEWRSPLGNHPFSEQHRGAGGEHSTSIWLGIPSNFFLSHEILPSLARYRDL